MKKIILIAFAAIAFTTATQAQDSTSSKKMHHEAKMQHSKMFDELNLTSEQQDKMKTLREDNKTKMDAIKNNSSLSDADKQQQMKALRMEQRKNMDAILTDEQKAKMKEMRQDRMKEHKGMNNAADSTMKR